MLANHFKLSTFTMIVMFWKELNVVTQDIRIHISSFRGKQISACYELLKCSDRGTELMDARLWGWLAIPGQSLPESPSVASQPRIPHVSHRHFCRSSYTMCRFSAHGPSMPFIDAQGSLYSFCYSLVPGVSRAPRIFPSECNEIHTRGFPQHAALITTH